jgi:hypothetical protein
MHIRIGRMPERDFPLSSDEAEAIGRLSTLEQMRDAARQSNRAAMLANVEKLIEAELRAIQRLRDSKASDKPTGAA